MPSVIFRRQARREFDEAGDWYEQERAGLGLEFLAEINRLIQRITSNPEQFPILYRDVHKAVAQRFPYCVYFRERDQHIIVLAVFHSARNPAVWQQRAR
ncbi:MAG: type II toxin-antitoxin system RelE/ParE family toxin [Proteobacteria bacterium]|nr:type II toxin-antitoxin system RelE/ParE family toxin [Pseudomonadota bacterium]